MYSDNTYIVNYGNGGHDGLTGRPLDFSRSSVHKTKNALAKNIPSIFLIPEALWKNSGTNHSIPANLDQYMTVVYCSSLVLTASYITLTG